MSQDRFIAAQASSDFGYETARRELQAGQKQSHWIWYIFPQLARLGHSPTAQYYAFENCSEAIDYLREPTLRRRLLALLDIVSEQLSSGILLTKLMGGETDAQKLISSITLFGGSAETLSQCEASADYGAIARCCAEILHAAAKQGYPPCRFTLSQCRALKKP